MTQATLAESETHSQGRRTKAGCWIAGSVALALVFCCCGGAGLFGLGLFRNQQEGVVYADRLLRSRAFMKWDVDALLAEAAPEYKGGMSDAEARKKTKEVFAFLKRKVGLPLEFGSTAGFAKNSFNGYAGTGGGRSSAESVVETSTPTRFEKGRASIQLTLFKEDGQWKIGRFYVTGDDLSAPTPEGSNKGQALGNLPNRG